MAEIRTLLADEIECRIGTTSRSGKGASILLYKNSRVDMAILDEVYGPAGWMRDHKELKGVIYCGVAVNVEGEWIWKWDAGVESNTEPQKGEASDSFKRACVNWGIGRELYTAPFIWVKDFSEEEWNGGKPRINFHVAEITYDEKRNIKSLVIVDETGKERFTTGRRTTRTRQQKPMETKSPAIGTETPQESVHTPVPTTNAIRVTMAIYEAGKCGTIIDNLAKEYDKAAGDISAEAKDYIKNKYNWDERAYNAVIADARKKGQS